MPRGGSIRFLMVVGFQNQIAGGEKDFLYVGILTHLFARGFNDEAIMFAGDGGFVFHAPAFEGDPGDAHGLHVFFAEITGVFGVEGDHLGNLFARVSPMNSEEGCAWIIRAFGIFHHLPETFEARVAFAVKGEWRRGEIGEQAQLIALGKNHFTGTGGLRENFPRRCAIGGDGCPPVGGVVGAGGEECGWRAFCRLGEMTTTKSGPFAG